MTSPKAVGTNKGTYNSTLSLFRKFDRLYSLQSLTDCFPLPQSTPNSTFSSQTAQKPAMAEVGETSGAKPSGEIWAKLVPSDSRFPDVEIRDLVLTQNTLQSQDIGSDESLICSPIDNCEWCRITRNPDRSSATIQNKSSNAILVDGTVIQSEESTVIRSGSEIISGPAGEGCLSYRFNVLPGPETCQKTLKISVDAEHAKCCICLNTWHDAVTIAPCFHNFCNGCFSEWLRRSQEKRSSVLCPQCRGVVQFVGRNHFLHNIAGEIMNADSSLRRSNEDTAVLDSYATVQSNLVIKLGKGLLGKRVHSAVQDEGETVELPCPQRSTQFVIVMRNLSRSSCTGFEFQLLYLFFPQMHQKGQIAEMEKEQGVEWTKAQSIGISTDLVAAAKQQLQFLAAVDRNRYLSEGPALQRAIYRLNPVRYKTECEELYGRILDNSNVVSSVQGSCKIKLKKFGIVSVERQCPFFYQVSPPHMNHDLFLEAAVSRYKGFLHLIKSNNEKSLQRFCVPTYDIVLIWHSHQLHPVSYCKDLHEILGKVLEHDDTNSDRTRGKKLHTGFSETTKQWEEAFGTSNDVIASPDHQKVIELPEVKTVEVFLEFLEVRNLPEVHRGMLFASFSKTTQDIFFNAKRQLNIFSEFGEKQIASFRCEPTG
ncbi:hypothetical protein ACLB2K_031081 [Fragaria x ananassa]